MLICFHASLVDVSVGFCLRKHGKRGKDVATSHIKWSSIFSYLASDLSLVSFTSWISRLCNHIVHLQIYLCNCRCSWWNSCCNMVVKPAPGIVSCPDQQERCSQHSYIVFLPSQEEVIRSIWANSCFFVSFFAIDLHLEYSISSYFHRSCTLPGVGKIPEDCARDRGHTDVVWLQDSKTEACRCPCQLPTRSVEAGHFASTQGRFLAANWNWKTGKTGRCC